MPDYRKMYAILFNAITDAIEALEQENLSAATVILKGAQLKTEQVYLNADEP